jgi:hypothetical protein
VAAFCGLTNVTCASSQPKEIWTEHLECFIFDVVIVKTKENGGAASCAPNLWGSPQGSHMKELCLTISGNPRPTNALWLRHGREMPHLGPTP